MRDLGNNKAKGAGIDLTELDWFLDDVIEAQRLEDYDHEIDLGDGVSVYFSRDPTMRDPTTIRYGFDASVTKGDKEVASWSGFIPRKKRAKEFKEEIFDRIKRSLG